MGKAARLKQQRRAARTPPQVGKRRSRDAQTRRVVWGVSVGVAAGIAVVATVLLMSRSQAKPPPPAAASAADNSAPASLVAAADAVGFRPTTEPGVGLIEDQPATAAQPPQNTDLLPVGTLAPVFALRTPQGRKVGLAAYRGRAVLLEFFATWCPHCNAEAPHLRALDASLPQSKVGVVSVNADGETAPSVYAFHRYYGLQYPALLDPSPQPGSFTQQGAAGPVTNAYRVEAYPTFYVLDRRGRITWRSDGEQPDALLRLELRDAAGRG